MKSTTLAALASLLPLLAQAHHGFGTFDLQRDIELTGTVTGLDFVNPHSWLYLDVTREDGTSAAYRCEMRAATVLRRSGWSPDMFAVGDTITVTGSPDRNDPNSCYVSTVIFADGSSIDRYGQRTEPTPIVEPDERPLRLASGELNISGDWAPEQRVMTDPQGRRGTLVPLSQADDFGVGGVPEGAAPLRGTRGFTGGDTGAVPPPAPVEPTAVGRAAAEGFDLRSPDNPRMRCETTSILFDWTFDGPVNRITQRGDTITLEYGQLGFTRTIRMSMDAHPADIEPSRGGHSIGRWEDDVLIVDTVGFAPGVLSPPVMHGEALHVVERFALDTDTMQLTRSYVAEDPEYFAGRYTGSDTIGFADLPYAPDECQELTFVDYSEAGRPAAAGGEPQWWEFWRWFD